jgi:multiple sugar transport system ATP-binding protein
MGNPSMNFFPEAVTQGDDLLLAGHAIRANGSLPPGRFLLGVRPEDLRIDEDSPLRMQVTLVEPTGGESYVYGRMAGRDLILRAPGDVPARIGITSPSASTCAAHFFDPTAK